MNRGKAWIEPSWILEHEPAGLDARVPRVILVDEVHWARGWASWLKGLVDEDRAHEQPRFRVLATDSSASLLRGGSIEPGQGRWNEVGILGLSFSEYLSLLARDEESPENVFARAPGELERYLMKGGFPEHVAAEPGPELWEKLREDIAERAVRRDLLAVMKEGGELERIDVEKLMAIPSC